MVMQTVTAILENLGADDIDGRLEERLIDGVLYAFQEQAIDNGNPADDLIMLEGFGVVVNSLGVRTKPYLTQIGGTIKWRMNNKSSSVRMQAADLIGR
jgi:splicing factor 3B subunit 1|tara:strand:- start:530 stop:823 length:294 start_codon:yes stop_codon:yes gene_type:complete